MMRRTRVFGRLLAINVSLTFVYRGDFLILQLANVMVPVISLLVWRAALSGGADLPVDAAYLDTYFVTVAVVSMLTSSWSAAFLSQAIRNGDLNRWLIRPASNFLDGAANNVGEKAVKIVLLIPVIVLVVVLLPGEVSVPGRPLTWALFVLAILFAAVIAFAFDIARASLAFWFEDVQGFHTALDLVSYVLSGAVVPLVLLPTALAGGLQWQPFRFIVSFPIEVLLGQVPGGLALGFAQQLGWLVAMVLLACGIWRLGLRQYSAAGA